MATTDIKASINGSNNSNGSIANITSISSSCAQNNGSSTSGANSKPNSNSQTAERVKPVETLVLANIALKAEQKRLQSEQGGNGRKEDERITTAVMKVLEGYDWNLVQAQAK